MSRRLEIETGYTILSLDPESFFTMEQPSSSTSVSGKTILFVSLPRHDAKYTSTPWQLAVQLAKTNNVIFTDHPFSFQDAATKFREPGVKRRLKSYLGGEVFMKEGVYVVRTPFVWPTNFLPKGRLYNFFSQWNQRILAARLNAFFKKQGITSLVYINSFNFYYHDLPKYLRAKTVVNIYHCIDPMIKSFTLKHGQYLQEKAARSADVVVATAPALLKPFQQIGLQTFLVPNAANFKHFNAATSDIQVHLKLQSLSGKVVGYFGNIERRTDFKLLSEVVDLLTEWHLVMAGPYDKSYVPENFLKHPRIHFTGPFSHEEAPSVIKRFDVAIIPFKCDEVSNGIYPLKLYEYLAAGKPVVSTNFNPDILAELSGTVSIADTAQEFANSVLLAYATDSEKKIAQRIAVAANQTWEHRASQFEEIIKNELTKKNMEPVISVMKPVSSGSLKERIKSNPRLKKFVLSLIFRKKPYGSRVKWYIWLWLIFPRYFQRGISWASRLDLVPFNKFKIGKYSRVEQGVVINNGMGDVIIHDEVHTGIGCVIIGPVTMHKHVGLSQYVRVLGMHHGSDADSPHHYQRAWKAPVILEEDAFIGTGTVIMGKKNGEPLVLGRYCRVGANSVVTTDIPPYSVAVGNPAKVVRVWDFENKCWKKPSDDSVPSKRNEKENTIAVIDPTLLTDPKFNAQG
ncbi:MAG TPA: glycosyltransferase [Chryseosolibacter sp.]